MAAQCRVVAQIPLEEKLIVKVWVPCFCYGAWWVSERVALVEVMATVLVPWDRWGSSQGGARLLPPIAATQVSTFAE